MAGNEEAGECGGSEGGAGGPKGLDNEREYGLAVFLAGAQGGWGTGAVPGPPLVPYPLSSSSGGGSSGSSSGSMTESMTESGSGSDSSFASSGTFSGSSGTSLSTTGSFHTTYHTPNSSLRKQTTSATPSSLPTSFFTPVPELGAGTLSKSGSPGCASLYKALHDGFVFASDSCLQEDANLIRQDSSSPSSRWVHYISSQDLWGMGEWWADGRPANYESRPFLPLSKSDPSVGGREMERVQCSRSFGGAPNASRQLGLRMDSEEWALLRDIGELEAALAEPLLPPRVCPDHNVAAAAHRLYDALTALPLNPPFP